MRIPTVTGPELDSRAVEQAAWVFYAIAALGSSVGQIWVGVITPPWPVEIAWWWRALLVAPFAVVIDLAGAVSAAFADKRRRLGERAYDWRIVSAVAITIAVAINVVGHRHVPYLAVVFGGLGSLAYAIWLLHSGARRRDALRAAHKLAGTSPVYGLRQWRREPEQTALARGLALEFGYGVQESLSLARRQLRDEKRQQALSQHIEALIRDRHENPILAEIATTTLDVDALAAELTARADINGWAQVIAYDLRAPQLPDNASSSPDDHPASHQPEQQRFAPVPVDVLRRVPTKQADYDRWRTLWKLVQAIPEVNNKTFGDEHGLSLRQVQWIRSVGATGLLDSPVPPAIRLVHMAQRNGQRPADPLTIP
jgi:hypothetical protein